MSENGNITGYLQCAAADDKSYVWPHDSSPQVLSGLPSKFPDSRANDVNNDLYVVGRMTDTGRTGIYRAFMWKKSKVIELELLPGARVSEAMAITETDPIRIAGFVQDNVFEKPPITPVIWDQKGHVTELKVPIGPNASGNDINENGDVCGWMGALPTGDQFATAFLRYADGTVIDLGVPKGAYSTAAFAINNHAEVVGQIAAPSPYPNYTLDTACILLDGWGNDRARTFVWM